MAILWAMWWIEETKQKTLSSAQIQLPPPCLLLKMGHRALALFVQDREYGTRLDFFVWTRAFIEGNEVEDKIARVSCKGKYRSKGYACKN